MKSRHGRTTILAIRDNELQQGHQALIPRITRPLPLFSLHSLLVLQAAFTRAASALHGACKLAL